MSTLLTLTAKATIAVERGSPAEGDFDRVVESERERATHRDFRAATRRARNRVLVFSRRAAASEGLTEGNNNC
jgi:hypothetical protein